MVKSICYISSISTNTSESDIDLLSEIIAQKNKDKNITGIMIIQNGHFLQVMEGEETVVDNTYQKILLDERHYGLIKLLDKEIDHRLFEGYASGSFSVISNLTDLKKLKIYFDWIQNANIPIIDELILLTNNFLHYNK